MLSLPRVESPGKLVEVHQSNVVTFTALNDPVTPSAPSLSDYQTAREIQMRFYARLRVIQRAAPWSGLRMFSAYNTSNKYLFYLQSSIEACLLFELSRVASSTLNLTFFKIVRNAFIMIFDIYLFLMTSNPAYMIKLVYQRFKIQFAPTRRAQNIPVPLLQDGSDSFWVGTFCPSSGNWRNHGWTWNLNSLPVMSPVFSWAPGKERALKSAARDWSIRDICTFWERLHLENQE